MTVSQSELDACLEVLEAARALDPEDPRYVAIERACAHLTKTAKKKRRAKRRAERARHDQRVLAGCERVATYREKLGVPAVAGQRAELPAAHLDGAEGAPSAVTREAATGSDGGARTRGARHCYVCGAGYHEIHGFYHALCPACAERSFAARDAPIALEGRRALVTGGRIKIGFAVACRLLRCGAHVTVTTRFPHDAARRYAACDDFAAFRERLSIVELDLRDLPGLIGWLDAQLERGDPLDVLVNNAAQTVRRPAAYYAELLEAEQRPLLASASAELLASGDATAAGEALAQRFTAGRSLAEAAAPMVAHGQIDEHGAPLDLRERNSWVLGAEEIPPVEALEVHLVNAVAPLLLVGKLRPLLERSPFADRYIVNASGADARFSYRNKTSKHPHVNMSKAALNMLTRTSATDYAEAGIYINSVDTGWISDDNPLPLKRKRAELGFCPPLDTVDAAARILAPVARGIAGDPTHGRLYKDFEPVDW